MELVCLSDQLLAISTLWTGLCYLSIYRYMSQVNTILSLKPSSRIVFMWITWTNLILLFIYHKGQIVGTSSPITFPGQSILTFRVYMRWKWISCKRPSCLPSYKTKWTRGGFIRTYISPYKVHHICLPYSSHSQVKL